MRENTVRPARLLVFRDGLPSKFPPQMTPTIQSVAPTRQVGAIALCVSLLVLAGCTDRNDRPLFKLLSPNQTGITFANTITTDDSLNVQNYVYTYNGAGVAVGDINNDGLPDIFFAGNMVSSRLY